MIKLRKVSKEPTEKPYTAWFYCDPGVGKSSAIAIIAGKSDGNTLVIDVDKTIERTIDKSDIISDEEKEKILICDVDIAPSVMIDKKTVKKGAFENWKEMLSEVTPQFLSENNIKTVAIDNLSALQRIMLADLGVGDGNGGVPSKGSYQKVQFALISTLIAMKSWGVNVIVTAWEASGDFEKPNGEKYTRVYPMVSEKILADISGYCDIVGRIAINKAGKRGILMAPTLQVYAKNQIDNRPGCLVEDFLKFDGKKKEKPKEPEKEDTEDTEDIEDIEDIETGEKEN